MIHVIDNAYIYIRPEGVFDAATLRRIAEGLQEIERERSLRLSDVSAVTELRFEFTDFADYAKQRSYPAGDFQCRTAFYVTDNVKFGYARMCQTLIESPRQEIRIFRDLDEAARWLGISLEPLVRRGFLPRRSGISG